jgi:hypothetical protein
LKKWIRLALVADRGSGAVTGDDGDLVGEGKEALVDRVQELMSVAAGQVCAADRAGEEGISCEQEGLGGEIEAHAAFGVAGSVEDGAVEAGDGDEFAVLESVVGSRDGGGWDAEPAGLNVHHFDQGEILLVVEDGGAGELLEAMGSGDVVDVGVGDDDHFDGEAMPGDDGHDAGDVIARVDDDGFVGVLVAQNGAVALQRTDREDLVDHRVLDLRWGSKPDLLSCEMKDAQACGLRISED